jgi:hypothetical protein
MTAANPKSTATGQISNQVKPLRKIWRAYQIGTSTTTQPNLSWHDIIKGCHKAPVLFVGFRRPMHDTGPALLLPYKQQYH